MRTALNHKPRKTNMPHTQQQSIGKDKAIELYNSKWWEGLPDRDVATFQLFTAELCMPFGDFQMAMERTLKRPVWTHEFASFDRMVKELMGEAPAPTFQEILDMIPAEKRILVQI